MYNLIGMPCISLFADIRHEWGLPDPYQVYVLRGGGGGSNTRFDLVARVTTYFKKYEALVRRLFTLHCKTFHGGGL